MPLSKDEILKPVEPVSVEMPEWGGEVRVRPLSAKASMAIVSKDDEPQSTMAARLIVASLVDEAGEPLLGEDDIGAVEDLDAKGVLRLSREIMKLNGLAADEIERTAGESEPSPGEGSSIA